MDRDKLKDTNYFKPEIFDGAQIAYSWRQLEPGKDEYDFSIIEEDLAYLKKLHRKLFIQLEDVSFNIKWNHTPKYVLADTMYHGGADLQYTFDNSSELHYHALGWVTRRWDPAVQQRLYKLFRALGKAFDGRVEGINTEETSATFGSKAALRPPGFSFYRYMQAWMENLTVLKAAFPHSLVMVYANFMPGGFLPTEDTSLLPALYRFAWRHRIAVGGPDLLPYQRWQMTNSYPLILQSFHKVPTALAVQDGTGDYIDPHTGKRITAKEIYDFGADYLHLNYIFWGAEEPFFSVQTLPWLREALQPREQGSHRGQVHSSVTHAPSIGLIDSEL